MACRRPPQGGRRHYCINKLVLADGLPHVDRLCDEMAQVSPASLSLNPCTTGLHPTPWAAPRRPPVQGDRAGPHPPYDFPTRPAAHTMFTCP